MTDQISVGFQKGSTAQNGNPRKWEGSTIGNGQGAGWTETEGQVARAFSAESWGYSAFQYIMVRAGPQKNINRQTTHDSCAHSGRRGGGGGVTCQWAGGTGGPADGHSGQGDCHFHCHLVLLLATAGTAACGCGCGRRLSSGLCGKTESMPDSLISEIADLEH